MIGRIVKPRVYIEGIEVKSIYKVTVQSSINTPAVAIIELPPDERFFDRPVQDASGKFTQQLGVTPRTLIHVFYDDSEDPDQATRLLFEGELVRYSYEKTASGRCLRIYARDISNILSSIYVRYYSDFFTQYGKLMTAYTGIGPSGVTQQIRMSMLGAPGTNPEIVQAFKGDTGGFGIASALRQIVIDALQTNTFFTNFDFRTKVSKKIVTLVDTHSKALLEPNILISLIQQNMGNLKESATVWDLYSMLMSLVFYYPVSVPAAPFLGSPISDTGSSGKAFSVSPGNTLMSLLIKPYSWFTAPPTFNVIFPSQYKTFSIGRDFLSEPTRLMMSAFGVIESLAQQPLEKSAPSHYFFIAPNALQKRYSGEVFDSAFKATAAQLAANQGSVTGLETQIELLGQQLSAVEIQLADPTKSTSQKQILKTQASQIQADLATATAKLTALLQKISTNATIQAAGSTSNAQAVNMQTWNRSVMTGKDDISPACREDLKGIIFAYDYLTQTQVEFSRAGGIKPLALQKYLSNVADFKLSVQQYKGRIADISMIFSPQLVAGFPALIVDPHQNFMGELETVTHTFDANGLADTTVQVSFVRGEEVEFSEKSRNEPGNIQLPLWVNPKYQPNAVGDQVYRVLFPQNKPNASKPGIPAAQSIMTFSKSSPATQVSAAREIRRLYFMARDPDRFALNFTRRNIATIDQVFLNVLGGVRQGGTYIIGSPTSERFLAAQAYVSAVNAASAFARSDTQTAVGQK